MAQKQFSSEIIDGVRMAADIVLHKNIMPTYLASKMPDAMKQIMAPEKSTSLWSKKFIKAFKNKEFCRLIDSIIAIGNDSAWKDDPKKALMFGDNKMPPDDAPQLISYINVRKKLCSNKFNAHWVCLAISAISRMIAVNASNGFKSNEWSEFTLAWFDIEKHFLSGDGKRLAEALVSADSEFFEGKMNSLTGTRLTHALAELSINTYDTDFFC
jgi:hypothetical protein